MDSKEHSGIQSQCNESGVRVDQKVKVKCFYDHRRHWFHLSHRLRKNGKFVLKPWGKERAINRDKYNEPDGIRIPVAPTISQCLTALPQGRCELHIYRTVYKVKAKKPKGVFDAEITKEGWLIRPTKFIYMGTIDFDAIEKEMGDTFWPEDAACCGGSGSDDILSSKEALEDWQKLMTTVDKYIKPVTFDMNE